MTPSDIARYRLWNQQIAPPRAGDVGAVVARLGAVQAQDYPGAKWSLGLRLAGANYTEIDRAIADRAIVRTWPMRGTLHFVAAADARWMLELLTPRIVAGSAGRHRQLELDDATFARSREVFTAALQGGRQRTREEMYQALEAAGIRAAGQRGYHLLWRAAQDGLICFGPHAGRQPTFVLLDEWLPGGKYTTRRARDEALAELARRYVTGHGPATLQDFVWWSGLTVADAKAGLDAVKADFAHVAVDGKTYWMPPDLPDRSAPLSGDDPPGVHLLPGFDEYLLGYTDRSAALDPQHAPKIVPGSNGMFLPTIVLNGRVAGTWRRTVRKREVVVTAQPFAPLGKAAERALAAAAQRYGAFLGLPTVVEL